MQRKIDVLVDPVISLEQTGNGTIVHIHMQVMNPTPHAIIMIIMSIRSFV
jgi:hypothetical protein